MIDEDDNDISDWRDRLLGELDRRFEGLGRRLDGLESNLRRLDRWLRRYDDRASTEERGTADPQRAKVFAAWSGLGASAMRGLTTRSLIARAAHNAELRQAFLDVAESDEGGCIDPTRLGNWLRTQIGMVALDHRLDINRQDRARPRWRLAPLGTVRPGSDTVVSETVSALAALPEV
jgi:hypothetical protein